MPANIPLLSGDNTTTCYFFRYPFMIPEIPDEISGSRWRGMREWDREEVCTFGCQSHEAEDYREGSWGFGGGWGCCQSAAGVVSLGCEDGGSGDGNERKD